jgi:transcriptional regulator with XRE-family HTH domain
MIGERVKEKRKALGITQERLARNADMPSRVVSSLERGETTDPRMSTVAALAKALGCTTDYLIFEPEVSDAGKRRKGK